MAAPRPEAALPGTGFLAPGPRRLPPAGVSPGRLRSQRLGRALRLWVPAGIVLLILATCFVLPLLTRLPSPTNGNILDAGEPPFSPGHWLGTDPVGVDVFSQLVYGGQVAFEVGLAVTAIGVVVGGLLGITAGYFGGWVDGILSRVVDILIAFPALVLALAIAEGLGPSEVHVIWALSFYSVPAFARLARAATLRLRDQNFMLAASLSGTRRWRIVLLHLAPNLLPQLLTFALLGAGVAIIQEGALSFLSLGVPPPGASWRCLHVPAAAAPRARARTRPAARSAPRRSRRGGPAAAARL